MVYIDAADIVFAIQRKAKRRAAVLVRKFAGRIEVRPCGRIVRACRFARFRVFREFDELILFLVTEHLDRDPVRASQHLFRNVLAELFLRALEQVRLFLARLFQSAVKVLRARHVHDRLELLRRERRLPVVLLIFQLYRKILRQFCLNPSVPLR